MRILHSIHSVNPAGGGVIEAVRQLATAHGVEGHEVEVVSLDLPDAEWVRESELTVHALGRSRSGYGYSGALVQWLRARESQYDAVIVNGLWQYSSFGIWRALKGTALPYFVFPHGMLDPWFKVRYPLKHLKKALYWRLAEHRVLRDAAAVLFTSDEERRLAGQSFKPFRCTADLLPLGIMGPEGGAEEQVEAFHARFPHLREKRLFLFLGRLHEKKGCELLIQAWKSTSDRRESHLVVAGPCADEEYLRKLKGLAAGEASISFPGMLTGDVKWGALRAADAFVLPSHQENFGIAVAEALACGTPVLISNKVNIWREIETDGAGLVEPDDFDGTMRLVARWSLFDPQSRRDYSARAMDCFRGRFEIRATAHRLIEIIRSHLGAPLSASLSVGR